MAFSLSLVLILSACRGSKNLKDRDTNAVETSAEIALKKIKAQTIDFQFFNSSANLDIKSEFFNGGANAKFRIIKDSVIWVSVSKFGFEAARMLITKDSLFALERIQKTYIKSSFAEASEQIGFEINFNFLQDFILGNPYLHEVNNQVNLEKGDTIMVFPLLNDYVIQHNFVTSDYKLRQTHIRDEHTKVEADLSYGDYQQLDPAGYFSYLRTISVDAQDDQESSVAIKFSNPELNIEKPTKFTIPDQYSARAF